jgi:hypothetical protein
VKPGGIIGTSGNKWGLERARCYVFRFLSKGAIKRLLLRKVIVEDTDPRSARIFFELTKRFNPDSIYLVHKDLLFKFGCR